MVRGDLGLLLGNSAVVAIRHPVLAQSLYTLAVCLHGRLTARWLRVEEATRLVLRGFESRKSNKAFATVVCSRRS